MKRDRSSTQPQERMQKRVRSRSQRGRFVHCSTDNVTPKRIVSSCSYFLSSHGGEENGPEPSSWLNRKFYILEYNGKPAEVYCTDLIHKAKQYQQRQRLSTDDGRQFLRLVDKWRVEWNEGVQMPLGTSKDSFLTETTNLFPDLVNPDCFQLPSKLVALDTSDINRYINEKQFQFVTKPPNLYYTLDEEDLLWLKKHPNGIGANRCKRRPPAISPRTFVDVMNCFELLTYKGMHDALLEPIKRVSKSSEDDVECCICRWPSWETDDQIVFCDGCNIAVHQVCYGIAEVPSGQWFCQLCSHFGPSTAKECLFCPVRGGAMKATKNFESWAHIICALFLIEVRFGDAERREPITHINEVPAEKLRARCCVCDTCSGACIKCTHPKCDETFHVTCAQFANFVLDIENDDRELNGVKYLSLCGKHSSRSHNQQQRNRNFRFNKNRLSEIQQHFEQYVEVKVVAAHLGVSAQIVTQIYDYWVSKRNKNGKRPLIIEPEDSRSVTIGTAIPVVVERQEQQSKKRAQQPHNFDKPSNSKARRIRRVEVTKQGQQRPCQQLIDKIRQFRIHSEKARNLCYMVTRREKLKKQRLLLEWRQTINFTNI